MADALTALIYPPANIAEQRTFGFDANKNPVFRYSGNLIGKLVGANMNVTTDNTIPIVGTSNYFITRILVTNASIDLDTAVGGVYTAASKGGTVIVANTQVYSALTTAAKAVALTLAAGATDNVWTGSSLFLSLTTAQGAAATADIYVFGDRLD